MQFRNLINPVIFKTIFKYFRPNILKFGTFTDVVRCRKPKISFYFSPNFSIRPIPKREFCSANDIQLAFLGDKNLYLKICRQIKSKSEEVRPVQLGYFPFGTVKHRQEKFFTQEILLDWWNLMENNLSNIEGQGLASSVFGLQKINHSTNGDVVKILKWNAMEKIVESILSDIENPNFRVKRLVMVLNALKKFRDRSNGEIILSENLKSILDKAVINFLSLNVDNRKETFMDHFENILFFSSLLGFIKSPKDLKDVIPICYEIFDSKSSHKTRQMLNRCHRIGIAFLSWNFNPGPTFVSKYFKAIERTYNSFKYRERFCVTVLKANLFIGLKFSVEEFKNNLNFWKREMMIMMQHLQRNEIDEILKLCVETYNGNLIDIENILSKEILHHLLRRTDSYIINSSYGIDWISVPSLAERKNAMRMDKSTYFFVKQILASEQPCSLSTSLLNELPGAALTFHNEHEFTTDVSIKWWQAFEPNLEILQGYRLTHSMYALMKINKILKGRLNMQFRYFGIHPVETLARFAIRDIKNVNFTDHTFSSLLQAVVNFFVNTATPRMSPKFSQEISLAFKSFFDPNYFYKRNFVHGVHYSVGKILFDANCLADCKPPFDCLKIIVECCSKNFNNIQFINDCNDMRNQLWNLYQCVEILVEWNVDPEVYVSSFTRLYFQEIQICYSKLGRTKVDSMLKRFLLRNILDIVLKMDKENDFLLIKSLWQSETWSQLNSYTNCDINRFFKFAKENGKFDHLADIVSAPVLNEFEKRLQLT